MSVQNRDPDVCVAQFVTEWVALQSWNAIWFLECTASAPRDPGVHVYGHRQKQEIVGWNGSTLRARYLGCGDYFGAVSFLNDLVWSFEIPNYCLDYFLIFFSYDFYYYGLNVLDVFHYLILGWTYYYSVEQPIW